MSDLDRTDPDPLQLTPAATSGLPDENVPSNGDVAAGQPLSRWTAVIWLLGGTVVFLTALIAVVVAARQLRPLAAARLGTANDGSLQRHIHQLQHGAGRQDRTAAARALVAMGPAAVVAALDAVTEFSPQTHQPIVPKPVIQALAATGPKTADALVEALRCEKENVRVAAADVLREMGPDAAGAVLPLAHLVQDHNLLVRHRACGALGNLGPAAVEAVPFLLEAASHEDPATRRWAIAALGRIGPGAKAAVAALTAAGAKDPEQAVRDAAAVALHQIDLEAIVARNMSQAGPELRDLMHALQAEDEFAAVAAARTLARKGPSARIAAAALALALRHQNKFARQAAAAALGAIGNDAKVVAPALEMAAKDKEAEVRDAAQKALAAIGG